MATNYDERANEFAKKYGVKLAILGREYRKHFIDDKVSRWVFKCRLSRGQKSYTFSFGQSIANGMKEPTLYDILACLQKSDCGDFSEFCREYGYDEELKHRKVYNGCKREYEAVVRLFGDSGECYDELCEIN